jgi:hypothetical protein
MSCMSLAPLMCAELNTLGKDTTVASFLLYESRQGHSQWALVMAVAIVLAPATVRLVIRSVIVPTVVAAAMEGGGGGFGGGGQACFNCGEEGYVTTAMTRAVQLASAQSPMTMAAERGSLISLASIISKAKRRLFVVSLICASKLRAEFITCGL